MATFPTLNPATGEVIGAVESTSEPEIQAAVARARAAQSAWNTAGLTARAELLLATAQRIEADAEAFARLVTSEQGKILAEARAEVADAARRIRWFAVEGAWALAGREETAPGVLARIDYRPVGVVAALAPWNFPVQIPLWTIAPALLAGNAVLFKPSELTPLVGERLASYFHDAGVPREVLAVVQGAAEQGEALARGEIDLVSLVGSPGAGRAVMATCAEDLKRIVLELGGKDPMIVLDDCDPEIAADAAVRGAFKNCGQVCCSVERLLVARPLYQRVVDGVADRTRSLRVGPGLDESSQCGPMVAERERRRVLDLLADARTRGGRILCGGKPIPGPGFFLAPAVVTELPESAIMARRETFGPALEIIPFDTEDEAVEIANSLPLGLTASAWSADPGRAECIADRLDAGTRAANMTIGSLVELPWGGRKQSGIGRLLGPEGVRAFTDVVTLRRPIA